MKLTFLGAAREVTGSCTLIEAGGHRFLVDCGMEQGKDVYPNADLPCAPGEIEAILLTHAHIDHSGRIPYLYKNGFRGPIYSTDATMDLCEIMLEDSAHIQEQEAEWKNRKAQRSGNELVEPDYTVEDAMAVMKQFVPQSYGKPLEVFPGITAAFTDVGHLLGSASITLQVTENGESQTIVFSGDIGNLDQPLIRNPQYLTKADFVVMESTYGDRTHGPKPDYVAELTQILQETFDRGGNVVIPSVYKDCIVIPQGATVQMQDKTIAYKVVDGKAVSTLISVAGINDGREYVVLDGLKAGDEIISEGAGLIREGTVVK